MKTFKIKLADKAAFINRCKKYDIGVSSFDLKDDELNGYFEFDVEDEKTVEALKQILAKAPKISFLHKTKTKKLTKEYLRKIIREELKKSLEA